MEVSTLDDATSDGAPFVKVTPRLEVSASLADGLPLLDLAAEVAEVFGGLVVADVHLATAADIGGLAYRDARGAVIVLDLDQIERLGCTLADVWAHELAHIIDPTFCSSSEPVRERWARRMGPVLVNREPSTVAEALRCAVRSDAFRFGWGGPRPYPLQPLLDEIRAESRSSAARLLGIDGRQLYRWLSYGLTDVQADRLATRAGLHPGEVWGDWWEPASPPARVCVECGGPAGRVRAGRCEPCYRRRLRQSRKVA